MEKEVKMCCNCGWCVRESIGGPTESICKNPQSLNYGQAVCPWSQRSCHS